MIEYIVNEEKRTVVAMIKFIGKNGQSVPTFRHSEFIFDSLWEALGRFKFHRSIWDNKEYYIKCNKMYFPKYMSAKAKCNPEDEWNEEYGKQLARERLVEKIHNYRSNSYKIVADITEEIKDFVM